MNGVFLYPSPDSQQLTFNAQDSVNVSWSTFAHNFASPRLMLWLTTSPEPHFNQTLAFNTSVPANGSLVVPLSYGGNYNLSTFNIQQGPLGTPDSFYTSGRFNIKADDQSKPQTWGGEAASSTSLSASVTSSTSLLATSTSSPTLTVFVTAPSPTSVSSSSQTLPSRAKILIIVFSVLVVIAVALLSVLLTIRTRRLKHLQDEIGRCMHQSITLHPQGDPNATQSITELELKEARREELTSDWAGFELEPEAAKSSSRVVHSAETERDDSEERIAGNSIRDGEET